MVLEPSFGASAGQLGALAAFERQFVGGLGFFDYDFLGFFNFLFAVFVDFLHQLHLFDEVPIHL